MNSEVCTTTEDKECKSVQVYTLIKKLKYYCISYKENCPKYMYSVGPYRDGL
jgi:hypothetical protein